MKTTTSRNIITLAGSVLALTLAVSVNAESHGCKHKHQGHQKPAFSEVDLNEDGFVAEDELAEFRAKRMAAKAAEGRKLKNAANAPSFSDIDTDSDGKISADEFAAHQKDHKCNCGRGKKQKETS